ncbi:DUF305 domain-containing protein [Nesterenkonia salmonea]|uniref:DUF305 domain-containing protein n=1 Tax=Nesterenkonia salmonea TaxID=1804987 RepID=A0A5R9BEM2_9MICC|nr:DUF305 domain-containing protein [Nesterenkonia salmonea]TLP98641.1 DUF305 domain-containing protein [Nesterenkonia salmonea]
MRISQAALAGAIVMTITLTGCGGDSDTSQEQDNDASATQAADQTASDDFNDADLDYVAGMIVHHEQAVEMADIVLATPDVDPEVAALAEQIQQAQGPEIERMNAWLEAWGQDGNGHGGHSDMDHGGMADEGMMMMSEEHLAELEAAEGPEASRLFLEQMVMHHQGAVTMAEQHLEEGENPEALELSEEVITDQSAEIDHMEQMLDEL